MKKKFAGLFGVSVAVVVFSLLNISAVCVPTFSVPEMYLDPYRGEIWYYSVGWDERSVWEGDGVYNISSQSYSYSDGVADLIKQYGPPVGVLKNGTAVFVRQEAGGGCLWAVNPGGQGYKTGCEWNGIYLFSWFDPTTETFFVFLEDSIVEYSPFSLQINYPLSQHPAFVSHSVVLRLKDELFVGTVNGLMVYNLSTDTMEIKRPDYGELLCLVRCVTVLDGEVVVVFNILNYSDFNENEIDVLTFYSLAGASFVKSEIFQIRDDFLSRWFEFGEPVVWLGVIDNQWISLAISEGGGALYKVNKTGKLEPYPTPGSLSNALDVYGPGVFPEVKEYNNSIVFLVPGSPVGEIYVYNFDEEKMNSIIDHERHDKKNILDTMLVVFFCFIGGIGFAHTDRRLAFSWVSKKGTQKEAVNCTFGLNPTPTS